MLIITVLLTLKMVRPRARRGRQGRGGRGARGQGAPRGQAPPPPALALNRPRRGRGRGPARARNIAFAQAPAPAVQLPAPDAQPPPQPPQDLLNLQMGAPPQLPVIDPLATSQDLRGYLATIQARMEVLQQQEEQNRTVRRTRAQQRQQDETHPNGDPPQPIAPDAPSTTRQPRGEQRDLNAPAEPQLLQGDDGTRENQGLGQAIHDLLGTQPGTSSLRLNMLLEGSFVDSKLKNKIWLKEYVELGSLVSRNELQSRVNLNTLPGSIHQLSFLPTAAKQPANFNEWTHWFSIFSSIYAERYPEESSEMFSYISRIYDLYREEPYTYNWRTYDELFRQVKSSNKDYSWMTPIPDLYRKAKSIQERITQQGKKRFDRNPRAQRTSTVTSSATRGQGTCNLFNESRNCPYRKCKYAHKCVVCQGAHPKSQCAQPSSSQK